MTVMLIVVLTGMALCVLGFLTALGMSVLRDRGYENSADRDGVPAICLKPEAHGAETWIGSVDGGAGFCRFCEMGAEGLSRLDVLDGVSAR